jgi:RecB family exonuclease
VLERRTLDQVTFAPDRAPSVDELARSLAASATPPEPKLLADELGLADEVAAELRDRLARARRRLERRRPGPLEVPQVLAELRGRQLFGASTLEEYALCSYRWFVQHELQPQTTDPEPEARAQGSAIHAVLEELYRKPPPGGPGPRSATLEAWRDRAAELVAEHVGARGLGGEDPVAVAARARMVALIDRFLEREAGLDSRLQADPELLEASFGEREGADRPALAMEGFSLHGKIDRVDVPAAGVASGLIRDYKVSRTVTTGANLAKEGKLQPQLYALALERLWGRQPLGGVYQPLAATDDHRPRGIAAGEEADGLLAGLELVGPDLLPSEGFREALDAAEARAGEIVAAMRAGRIDRDPIDDSCPPFCSFQAICRRERLAHPEPEPTDEDEEDLG